MSRQTLNSKIIHLEDVFKSPLMDKIGLSKEGERILKELEKVHLTLLSLVPGDNSLYIDKALMYDQYIKQKFQYYEYESIDKIISRFNISDIKEVIASGYLSDKLIDNERKLFKSYPVYAIGNPKAKKVVRKIDCCLQKHLMNQNIYVEVSNLEIDDLILDIIRGNVYLYTLFNGPFTSIATNIELTDVEPLVFYTYNKKNVQ